MYMFLCFFFAVTDISRSGRAYRERSPSPHLIPDNELMSDEDGAPAQLNKTAIKQRRKTLRNTGKSYTTAKGKTINARQLKPFVCQHKKDKTYACPSLTEDMKRAINEEYWALGEYNLRLRYVASKMTVELPKRKRGKKDQVHRCSSWKYHLNFNEMKYQVCRKAFLLVLSETDRFVRTVAEKKLKSVGGFPEPDQRGKSAASHKKKLSPATIEEIKGFINSVPAYVSHYCRRQTQQKYLPSHLNRTKLYKKYLNAGHRFVSLSTFKRVFKPMKLKFKKNHTDTCSKCDEFDMKIKCTTDEEEKLRIEKEHELHLRKAQKAYDLKDEKIKEAETDETKRVLVFDLEQCLPTPDVSTGKVYYLRQMYAYNLTIVDTKTGKTYCYMWHEGQAGRGANEISSSLFIHMIDDLPPVVTHVTIISDCCSGQNRNSVVAAALMSALESHPTLRTIDHIFLVPGHTRMECDSRHSMVERYKDKVEQRPCVPMDWYSLVEKAGEGKFIVKEVGEKFYDFHKLLQGRNSPLVKKKKDTEGNDFRWLQSCWFRYSKSLPQQVLVKSSYSNPTFQTVNFKRRGSKVTSLTSCLEKLPGVHPISHKKKADLLKILPLIGKEYHRFYEELLADEIQDVDPDLPTEDEESSEEED